MKSARTDSFELPEGFLDGFTQLAEEQKRDLIEALDSLGPTSIRLNPHKSTTEIFSEDMVPWCEEGRYLQSRPVFTTDPLHHSGAYYVQEAGSMFIEQLYLQGACALSKPKHILDLCASPGGKTTLLASLAGEEALVVANEVTRQRVNSLVDNVRRWGTGNIAVTSADPSRFAPLQEFFDLILVDAPCSGEGMFRKDHKARTEWSRESVINCAQRQRRILSDIWGSLAVGGTLIYSTCTFNEQENEENVRWMCETFDCQGVEINIDPQWNIWHRKVCGINTFRFLPHLTRSEGFFAAILRKGSNKGVAQPTITQPRNPKNKGRRPTEHKNPFSSVAAAQRTILERWITEPSKMRFCNITDSCYAIPSSHMQALELLSSSLAVIYSGVTMGRFFRDEFKPEHALALYSKVNREACPQHELSLEEALEYLRKHDLNAERFEQGINLLQYKGLPLGWIKKSGNKTTNMLPKELRIMTL